MSLAQLEADMEAEAQTRSAFKSQIEDLALVEVERLSREEETLASALQSVRSELTAARRVLGAVTPAPPKPEKKDKAAAGKTAHLSNHRREQALAWITNNVSEFNVKDAAAALEWSESQAATALILFREEGLVRLSRMGGSTNSTKFYRSMVGGAPNA